MAGQEGGRPAVSVVMAHYNDNANLPAALDSLARQEGAPDFEVLVVDNGSAVPPVAICDSRPGVRLLHEPRPGPGLARNRGAAEARAPVIAFFDADCEAAPDWIATMLATLEAHPEADILGGNVRIRPRGPRWSAVEGYEELFAYRQKLYIARYDFVAACNMAVRRAVWERVGPFSAIDLAEDVDWGQRAARMGCRMLYADAMRITTLGRESYEQVRRRTDRQMGQDYRASTGPLGKVKWALKTLALPLSPFVLAPWVLTHERLPDLETRWRTWVMLLRVRLLRTRLNTELMLGRDAQRMAERWRDTV